MTLVAVTCWHVDKDKRSHIADGYIQALEQVGLVPAVLPPALSVPASIAALQYMDGLVLTGGDDVSPLYFGQQPRENLGYIDALRDEQELALVSKALDLGLPVLGICRGLQVINIALGGTILQHVEGPQYIQHRQKGPRWLRHHHVEVKPGTILAGALGAGTIGVNSYHHQVIDKLAPGLTVSAIAPDGTIEAIEAFSPWLLAVQWHPEQMWQRYPEFLELFAVFAAACRGELDE